MIDQIPFNIDFSMIPKPVLDGALVMTLFIVTVVMLNKLRIVLTAPVKPHSEYGEIKALINQLETMVNAPRQPVSAPPPAMAPPPIMLPMPQYAAPQYYQQQPIYQAPSAPQQIQVRVNPPRPSTIIEIQVFPN